MSQSWFALQVRSRIEKSVQAQLQQKGYETFLPSYMSTRQWSDRLKTMSLPLFPGYVFCRFDFQSRLPLLVTPGVNYVVGAVDDSEISALQQVLQSRLHTEPWPYVRQGEMVRICRGPLKDLTGIVVRSKGADRLVVSLTLLMRSVSVEIDRSSIQPLAPQSFSDLIRRAS